MQTTLEERGEAEMAVTENDMAEPEKAAIDTRKLEREKLYQDIWQIGITRTAKKYGIPYPLFKQACQDAKIPLPTQSYWGNLAVGKSVERPVLPKVDFNDVTIELHSKGKTIKREKSSNPPEEKVTGKKNSDVTDVTKERKSLQANDTSEHPSESFVHKQNRWGGILYERETLYRELWSYPAVKVAKTYGVSDVMIHKVCKKLNVPTPPPGYWAKKKAGQNPPVIPLPDNLQQIY